MHIENEAIYGVDFALMDLSVHRRLFIPSAVQDRTGKSCSSSEE